MDRQLQLNTQGGRSILTEEFTREKQADEDMASQFPSAEKFNKQLQKKKDGEEAKMKTVNWRELEVDAIYRIDGMEELTDSSQFGGTSMLLKMTTAAGLAINVWATSIVAKELRGDGWKGVKAVFPCYIRPLGLKTSKKDAQRRYHAFQLLSEVEMNC